MRYFLALILMCHLGLANAAEFAVVQAGRPLVFPQDFGAHPSYKTEWWYVTGWLQTPDKKPLGFQITFFRIGTGLHTANPSQFAPQQLIIGHVALSDPQSGKILHEQKSARTGFGFAFAKTGNTDLKLDQWTMQKDASGKYLAKLAGKEFSLELTLQPTQALLLQGEGGYSRKGPLPEQASYYYSEPQLKVTGKIKRGKQAQVVTGQAWLDHEWSSKVLGEDAVGWDWVGANLQDGGALMAFQIRNKAGEKLWSHASHRDANGKVTQFDSKQVSFQAQRYWTSPVTRGKYPVESTVLLQDANGKVAWQLKPLLDNQELDARRSSGTVYWEGAVQVLKDGQVAGQGYLELTGYVSPMKM